MALSIEIHHGPIGESDVEMFKIRDCDNPITLSRQSDFPDADSVRSSRREDSDKPDEDVSSIDMTSENVNVVTVSYEDTGEAIIELEGDQDQTLRVYPGEKFTLSFLKASEKLGEIILKPEYSRPVTKVKV